MAKGSLRVNGIIVDTDGEIKASTGDSIVIREDDGSAVITVDTNGKTSIGGPMDVGVDDTGHDVKFFGATAGAYMLWDESQDDLIVGGAGQVGIGTTAPNTALHLKFTDNTTNASDNSGLTHTSGIYINNESTTTEAHSSIGFRTATTDGGIGLVYSGTANQGRFSFNLEGSERMVILHDGKVGIGTSAPDQPIHVATSATNVGLVLQGSYDNNANPQLQFRKSNGTIASPTAMTSGHYTGQIRFQGWDGNSYHTSADIYCVNSGTVADGRVAGNLVFTTAPDSVAGASERMRITSNGYVGIGTSSLDSSAFVHMAYQSQNLSLVIEEDNDGNSNSGLIIQKNHSTLHPANYYYGHILFKGWDGDEYRQAASIVCVAEGTPANNQMPGNLRFNVNNDTTGPTEAMRIVKTGKVGIGTTSTSNQLTVYTDDYMDSGALYPYNGATLHLKSTATNTDRGPGIAFSDGTEDKGFISMNDTGSRGGEFNFYCRTGGGGVSHMMKIPSSGSVQVNGGSVASISDIRIKKDVADLTDGLNIVNQLKPRTFKFNGKHRMAVDDGETHYGFVADEVLSVASQYVELTKDNIDGERLDDVKTISTGKMIPMLVNAVKELSAEVTALKNAR